MLNQLLRFTLVSSALLWLKPRWRGLLAVVVFVFMVHVLHGEYLSYVELSGNSGYLVWSYLLKWLALAVGLATYFYFAVMRGSNAGDKKAVRKSRGAKGPKPPRADAVISNVKEQAGADDGFDFLRQKKQLETRAEKLLHTDKKSSRTSR